ncbi:MAG: response regulator [Patescibacteria group bacterium]
MSKIFIAEDDLTIRRMYEFGFKLFGYEIESAPDGEKALEAINAMEPPPIAILLDIMMPKLSGFEVLQQLKANDKLKNIPVVVLTNLSGRDDIEKALGLGAALCLVKSQYDPKEVVEKVKEVIAEYAKKSNNVS